MLYECYIISLICISLIRKVWYHLSHTQHSYKFFLMLFLLHYILYIPNCCFECPGGIVYFINKAKNRKMQKYYKIL